MSAPRTRTRPEREAFFNKGLSSETSWVRSVGMTRSAEILVIRLQSVSGADSLRPQVERWRRAFARVPPKPEMTRATGSGTPSWAGGLDSGSESGSRCGRYFCGMGSLSGSRRSRRHVMLETATWLLSRSQDHPRSARKCLSCPTVCLAGCWGDSRGGMSGPKVWRKYGAALGRGVVSERWGG